MIAWAARERVPARTTPLPSKLQVYQVQQGDVEHTISAYGKLQLFKYVDLNAPNSGYAEDVKVSAGDEVKAGKLMLTIRPALPATRRDGNQAQLARLRAELAEQQAQLDFAELQYKRQTQLKAENATREESFEASRAAWMAASARLDAIHARIRQTELAIDEERDMNKQTQLVAPISGTVVSMPVRAGQVVGPGQQSTPLMRIADMSKLTVQARVAEIDVPKLRKGMVAKFTTPGYPGRQWSGKVRQIIPVPAEDSGEQSKETFYNVLFDVANPERQLMSGMTAKVDFVLEHAAGVPVLPKSALGKADVDGYIVTVIGSDRRLQRRRVRVGVQGSDKVQVLAGLAIGERVVAGEPPEVQFLPNAVAVETADASPVSEKPR